MNAIRYFVISSASVLAMSASAEQTNEQLQEQIEILQQRIEALERQQNSVAEQNLGAVELAAEREDASEAKEADEPPIHIGGALRFNVIYRDDVDASVGKKGESGLDVFRLNVDGKLNDFLISAEYRFYAYMNVIHHGWVGYEFDDDSQLQVGISQVPFGILPYASHNAWYGVPYYVGLADDYDMGVKYVRSDGPWSSQLAFYKNEELNDATNLDRYAFDLVRVGEQQNEETNTFNGRLAYTFGLDSGCETEVGASVEVGQMYNASTDSNGDRYAGAAHLDSRCGRWNFQLQGTSYEYDAKDPAGVDPSVVRVGAFAGSYDIDSDADVLVANIAYNLPSPWRLIDSLTCYNDYSLLDKSIHGAVNSEINTTGCAIGSGPLFTYVDYIMAKNMPYFGAGSLAGGGEDDWQGRFNINIGYYW
ncbi:porin [Gilvimarinus sp. DA14]|uniref:porin n=1 Tax=Gilvimarinus sp. DA14 TaxID=2956798 RepID=UPI0020B74A5D|nr:porin [Gilvimarinus sp. DA14]UTF58593.1 porin [Gilvimarinus sp. DA14]